MNTHSHYEIGQQVYVLDREDIGLIVEIEHVDDYVLDDDTFESPKHAKFQVQLGDTLVWRQASELRTVPDAVQQCLIQADEYK